MSATPNPIPDREDCYDPKDYSPIRCYKCGSTKLKETVIDCVGNTVAEFNVHCESCGTLVSYWGYGYYDPEFAVDFP